MLMIPRLFRRMGHDYSFFDTKAPSMHNRIRKLFLDRTTIDFENIPEVMSRTRTPQDTLRYLRQHKGVAGIVKAGHGEPELNLVHSMKDVNKINTAIHKYNGTALPYMVNIDDDEEEIRCTVEDVVYHAAYRDWPMFIVWNRFVPGKANRVLMRVVVNDWENSEAKWRGAYINYIKEYVHVNIFNEEYPRVILADVLDKTPGNHYLIRDLKRDLPDGIELPADYEKRGSEALFLFRRNIKTHIYDRYLYNKFDVTRIYDYDMATQAVPIEETKASGTLKMISQAEEDKIRRLAKLLGKDFDEVKTEIIESRQKRDSSKKK